MWHSFLGLHADFGSVWRRDRTICGGQDLGFRRILIYKNMYSKLFGNDFAREPRW
jgi:hypothetical protein